MTLVDLSATGLAEAVLAGEVSANEAARAMIGQVERLNPLLSAIVRFDPEAVLADADRIDRRLAAGDSSMRLPGVWASVKDNLWIEGRVASQGSRLFEAFVAPRSALAVDRARARGVGLLGSSNCSEFACKGVTTNLLYGATRNPWHLDCTPGGSSGGAAAAVSAGLGQIALCTDGGGSTRRPAAHCGIVGHKPSAGLVPHPTGFREPVFGNSVVGIMARTVQDVAAVLGTLAGPDARDWQCPPNPVPLDVENALSHGLNGIRVAFSPRLGLDAPVDADVRGACEQAARWLADAGAEVRLADPSWPQGSGEDILMPLQLAGLASLYGDRFKNEPESFDPDIAAQIEHGLSLSASAVALALMHREAMYVALAEFFDAHDLLLCPTTPCTAWPLDSLGPQVIDGHRVGPRGHAVFTPMFNHTYLPACSVPISLDRNGLPIGVQLVGRRFEDPLVLRAAARLQERADPVFRRPRAIPDAASASLPATRARSTTQH